MTVVFVAPAPSGDRYPLLAHETAQKETNERVCIVSKGKYSVELFGEGAEGESGEETVDRHDNLTVARAIYCSRVSQYPSRLVMLRDRACILARNDRPETMP
jgi:hypothetical protein